MPDPVKVQGTESERMLAFRNAYRTLLRRMTGFIELPISSLDQISLQRRLDELGRQEAAPAG
jgi:arsenate reductase